MLFTPGRVLCLGLLTDVVVSHEEQADIQVRVLLLDQLHLLPTVSVEVAFSFHVDSIRELEVWDVTSFHNRYGKGDRVFFVLVLDALTIQVLSDLFLKTRAEFAGW